MFLHFFFIQIFEISVITKKIRSLGVRCNGNLLFIAWTQSGSSVKVVDIKPRMHSSYEKGKS
jgi:hypothetical protein